MDYEEFISQTLELATAPIKPTKKKKTADEIIAEFMPIVEADRRKGG